MGHLLLEMKLGGKRDVLRAWQRCRQIAGILRYEPHQQAVLAASVFCLAQQVLSGPAGVSLQFLVDRDNFLVVPVSGAAGPDHPSWRLSHPLPQRDDSLGPCDWAWVSRQLNHRTPFRLFDEIFRLNEDFVRLHFAYQNCHAEVMNLRQGPSEGSAA